MPSSSQAAPADVELGRAGASKEPTMDTSACQIWPAWRHRRLRVDRHGSRAGARPQVHQAMPSDARHELQDVESVAGGTGVPMHTVFGVEDAVASEMPPLPVLVAAAAASSDDDDCDAAVEDGLNDIGYTHPWSTLVWRLLPSVERVPVPPRCVFATHTLNTRLRPHVPVPVFTILYPNAYFTILYSHGNATDCGLLKDTLTDLCLNLRVNVVSYEYSGYGATQGLVSPTEHGTYGDIEAVYRHVLTLPFCRSPEQLVLYGQSVGSGPTCYLASRYPVLAVVLHSPIASGLRVVTDNRCLACCDIFPNLDRMRALASHTTAVYIMHGQKDGEVPVRHGERLYQSLPTAIQHAATPWFPPEAGHNDLVEMYRDEYYLRLRMLLGRLAPRPHEYHKEPVVPPARLASFAARIWGNLQLAPEAPGQRLCNTSTPSLLASVALIARVGSASGVDVASVAISAPVSTGAMVVVVGNAKTPSVSNAKTNPLPLQPISAGEFTLAADKDRPCSRSCSRSRSRSLSRSVPRTVDAAADGMMTPSTTASASAGAGASGGCATGVGKSEPHDEVPSGTSAELPSVSSVVSLPPPGSTTAKPVVSSVVTSITRSGSSSVGARLAGVTPGKYIPASTRTVLGSDKRS